MRDLHDGAQQRLVLAVMTLNVDSPPGVGTIVTAAVPTR